MIYRKSNKPLAVVSFDSQTFFMLTEFLKLETNESVVRIEAEDFLKFPSDQYQYINLVVKDFELRKKISQKLDECNLQRWTFVSDDIRQSSITVDRRKKLTIGDGCFIYPGVWAYSGSIGNDVIIHSMVKIAENVSIGNGCFFSGGITIAGNCSIGEWCYLGNNLFFIDNVSICDNVRLLPGTNLRKSINQPGTYYNPHTYKIESVGFL
jgi:NDP-sugar pyrophosphorylase family protein